ncbi:MAG TPA: archaetidylserine decarboxylase, partial [Rhabdochlamydiaceae bacterium]
LLSQFYGFLQKNSWSRRKVKPFIEKFHVDTKEFLEPVDSFTSFNDFFIRKLKLGARPLAKGSEVAVLPADARYLAFQEIDKTDGFFVKGRRFSLEHMLQSQNLEKKYDRGSMLIARLCPTDYHRFHFPCECVPDAPKEIPGPLFSVNPIALKRYVNIMAENKRAITALHTRQFGTILYIEVGATYVGSIHQTFTAGNSYAKGDEKGYFSFGGSSLVLLFEPNRIQFDQDLLDASLQKMEIQGLLGQSLGIARQSPVTFS